MPDFFYSVDGGKVATIKAALPSLYPVNKTRGILNAILTALGLQDQLIVETVQNLKDSVFLDSAVGAFLDVIGNNYGVARPSEATSDDEYRALVRDIAFQPHTVIKMFRDVLTDFLGPYNGTNWDVFQINPAQVIIQVTTFDLSRTNLDAAYLHDGDGGTSTSVGVNFLTDSTKTWTANQWVNFTLADSLGNEFTITANNATTLTVVGTPAAGHYDILDEAPPSYFGPYFLNDETGFGSDVGGYALYISEDVAVQDLQSIIDFVVKASGIQVVFDTSLSI